jgi:putative lipoprotein
MIATIRAWTALGLACAVLAGCAGAGGAGPAGSTSVISGSATFRERMALPDNAIFEAVLEDISRADARAVVLGQQHIGPAGNPPYAIRIPYDASKIDPRGRYHVRASIRVNDQLWFTSDTAQPVLQSGGQNTVNVLMKRVGTVPPGAPPATQPGADGGPIPGAALVAPAVRRGWRVTQIQGQAITSASGPRVPTLNFAADKASVAGNSSCNNYSAAYQVQGTQIQFGPAMATKRACMNSVEPQFFSALQAVRSLRSVGAQLLLQDASGRTVLALARD